MASKSKNKGNSWEREICKFLSDTFGGNFMRVPNSGAFTGGLNAHRRASMSDTQVRNAKGDIIPPDHLPKLVIEAKNYKDFAFHQLLSPECKQLDTWIKQTLDTVDVGDVWFTIFKITRRGSYVAFDKKMVEQHNFKLPNHCIYKTYVVCDMKDFFEINRTIILSICV